MENLRSTYGQFELITRASQRIGAEFARQLANAGLGLGLVARARDKLTGRRGALQPVRHPRVGRVPTGIYDAT
jgi:short-subunit dehydrogenase